MRVLVREALRRPWQSLASVIGIALGVAVVVAVQIASGSVERGFRLSNKALSGNATHELNGGPGGFDEAVYLQLRRSELVSAAAPMVTAVARSENGKRFSIVGIDPFVDSSLRSSGTVSGALDPALIGAQMAVLMHPLRSAEMGLNPGDSLQLQINGRMRTVTLAGLLSDDVATRSWLVTDISSAQDLAGKRGILDRVDLVVDTAQQLQKLRAQLPSSVNLLTSQSQSNAQKEMTRALDTNLTALSLLALLIGMFLVYNAMSFSVLRRRRQIGLLRALGLTAREVFALVLTEALLVGLLASLVGVLVGLGLASVLLEFLTRTINDLYFRVEVTRLDFNPLLLSAVALCGVMASLLAALAPAIEATLTEPRAAMLRSDLERNALRFSKRMGWFGLIMLLCGALVVSMGGRSLMAAFTGLFFIIVGSALLVPGSLSLMTRLFSRAAQYIAGHNGLMAVRNIERGRSRTGVALAALVVAVSATSGVGLMIGNFRLSVSDWLASFLSADVYVAASEELGRSLPPDFVKRVETLDGVAAVDYGRWARIRETQHQTLLFAIDTTEARFSRYQLVSADGDGIFQRFRQGEILVTESLAWKRNLTPGDELQLTTTGGPQRYRVAAIYRDYGSDSGVVLIDGAVYRRHWGDSNLSSLALYLEPGADDIEISEQVASFSELPDSVAVYSSRSLQQESLSIFDRTFAVTRVLRLLAIIIAVVGIVSALTAIQTERLRQSALLRALGMTQSQLTRMSLLEAAAMGLMAGILALPVAVVTAWILANVVNRRAFGWSMDFHLDTSVLFEGVVISIIAAIIAGALAALSLNARSPASALRHE